MMLEARVILFAAIALAALYGLGALGCVVAFGRRRPALSRYSPPVTILKPLRGDDGYLYDNLATFCRQRNAKVQIVFGVQDPDDPAITAVHRLCRRFPDLDLTLVTDERRIGPNAKVSNLANLLRHAKHDVLILADSDMRVHPDYVRTVVAPLEDPAVGLVTCLYHGVAPCGLASALGAMFINEWFLPAALVGARLEPLRHAFGATIVVRRSTLESIGGLQAVADQLADDYVLGRLVSRRGLRVALAPCLAENVVAERNVWALFVHELRWVRTFRTVRPLSYFLAGVTYGIPLSLLALMAAGPSRLAVTALAVHLALRCGGRAVVYRALGRPVPWSATWLVPVRDILSFTLWVLSFLGRTVRWNDETFRVTADGHMEPQFPRRGSGRLGRAVKPASLGQE